MIQSNRWVAFITEKLFINFTSSFGQLKKEKETGARFFATLSRINSLAKISSASLTFSKASI
jgi:hypothetical protein